MLRSHKGDWHPQQDEFILLFRESFQGPPCFGLCRDAIPHTQDLNQLHVFYDSLVTSISDELPSEPEPELSSPSLSSSFSFSESEFSSFGSQ